MLKLWDSLAAKLVLKWYIQVRMQEELLTLLRRGKQACYQGLQDHSSPGFGPTYCKHNGIAAVQKRREQDWKQAQVIKGHIK